MEQEDLIMATSMAESKRAIEAILLVSTDPTPSQLLAQLLELPVETIEEQCCELAMAYDLANHGFQLVKVAGGWRYQTHPDLAPYVERFAMDGQSTRLSTAALETLAIVAYKQPMSRAQISAIRGVNVDAVLRTLVQRGYVEEVGRDMGAGQAVLFGTTQYFLERVGLDITSDLPSLGDFVPSAEVVEALEQTLKLDPEPEGTDIEDGAPAAEEPTADAEPDPVHTEVDPVAENGGPDLDAVPVAAADPADPADSETADADPVDTAAGDPAATGPADAAGGDPADVDDAAAGDPAERSHDRDAELVGPVPDADDEGLGAAEVISAVEGRSGVVVVEPTGGELDGDVVESTGREFDDH